MKTLTGDIGEGGDDSKRMKGWVSGRGNKRGSKSRPGPGVANERAPAGSSRGFEQAMTSLGASRRHPFHPRSMTRPCASRFIPHPFARPASSLPSPSPAIPLLLRSSLELNRVLVPVLKGAAAVSATWQPCLYLASTPSRTLVTSWLISFSLQLPSCLVDRGLPFSRSISFSPSGLCLLPFLSLGDINNAIAQAPNFRADGSNNV